jgi:hypothetical protein
MKKGSRLGFGWASPGQLLLVLPNVWETMPELCPAQKTALLP